MTTTLDSEPAQRLTTAEAAAVLKRAPQTLYNWRSAGKGPRSYKMHGQVEYFLTDLQDFMDANRVAN